MRPSLPLVVASVLLSCKDTSEPGTRDSDSPAPTSFSARERCPVPATTDDPAPAAWDVLSTQERLEIFPQGLSTGDAEVTSIQLATRAVGAARVDAHLARWTGSAWAFEDPLAMTPASDGYLRHLFTELEPCGAYRLVLTASDGQGTVLGRSAIGRFRLAWPDGALGPMNMILTGDTGARFKPFTLASEAAKEDADLYVFGGDFVYASGVDTREGYRGFYQENWDDPSLREIYTRQPVVGIWDDHDVFVDWNGARVDPDQREAARLAMFDYVAFRENPDNPGRLWRAFQWGDTVDVIVLDDRSEVVEDDPGRRMFSDAQLDWFEDRLDAVDTVFKLVVISLPLGNWPFDCDERIAAYPDQLVRLLSAVRDRGLDNVIWFSADHHIALDNEIPETGGFNLIAGPLGEEGPGGLAAAGLSLYPTMRGLDIEGTRQNYLRLRFEPEASPPRALAEWVTHEGEIILTDELSVDTRRMPLVDTITEESVKCALQD